LAGAFFGGFSAVASAASSASGVLAAEAFSKDGTQVSGMSESACGASAVRVFTVIGVAFSS
jgi:hypothetical protein